MVFFRFVSELPQLLAGVACVNQWSGSEVVWRRNTKNTEKLKNILSAESIGGSSKKREDMEGMEAKVNYNLQNGKFHRKINCFIDRDSSTYVSTQCSRPEGLHYSRLVTCRRILVYSEYIIPRYKKDMVSR
jgi:hypothetical protein